MTRRIVRRLALVSAVALALLASTWLTTLGWALFVAAPEAADSGDVAATEQPSSALGPLGAYLLPASGRLSFEGRVLERLAAGSYTYLRIERGDGTRNWVVTLSGVTPSSAAHAQPDSRVRVVAVGYAERFTSKRLSRSFDGLYFAVVRPG
jgi:hypothetical protein